MAEKDPIKLRLMQLIEELFKAPSASGSVEETRNKFDVVFKTKLLPDLKPALSTLYATDIQALITLLGILRGRYDLALERLQELFLTIFPLLPVVLTRAGNDNYSKAVELLCNVVQDISHKGSAVGILEELVGFIAALQEIWCHTGNQQILFLPAIASQLPHLNPPPSIAVAGGKDVIVLAHSAFKCCEPLLTRLPSSDLHAAVASACVYFGRTAFVEPIGTTVLELLGVVSVKVPVPMYHHVAATPVVCSFALQVCCSSALQHLTEDSLLSRCVLTGTTHIPTTSKDTRHQELAANIVYSCLEHNPESVRATCSADDISILITGLSNWGSRSEAVRTALKAYLTCLKEGNASSCSRLCLGLWNKDLPLDVQEVLIEMTAESLRTAFSHHNVLSSDSLSASTKRRRLSRVEERYSAKTLFGLQFGSSRGQASPLMSAIVEGAGSKDPVVVGKVLRVLFYLTDFVANPDHKTNSPSPSGFHDLCSEFVTMCSARDNLREAQHHLPVLKSISMHAETPDDIKQGSLKTLVSLAREVLNPTTLNSKNERELESAMRCLVGLTSDYADERLAVLLDVMATGNGAVAKPCCELVAELLMSRAFTEIPIADAAKSLFRVLKGSNKDLIFECLPFMLSAIYSPHHTQVDSDDPRRRSRSGSSRRRRAKTSEPTATFEYEVWQPFLSLSTPIHTMNTLATIITLGCDTPDLQELVKQCIIGGSEGIGLLASENNEERNAARRLVASLSSSEKSTLLGSVLGTEKTKGKPQETPLELLVKHISQPIAITTSSGVVHTLTLLLGTISRAVGLADPALGLVLIELVLQLKQGRPGRALTLAICRQELQCLETRLGIPMAELFKRFPEVYEPLLAELPAYNADRNYGNAPLLSVVSDYLDQDIETFVVENIPVMLAWIIRSPNNGDPATRAHYVCECIRELDEKKLQSYGLNFKSSLDKAVMLTELLLVYIQPIMVSVLLDTESGSWTDYFKIVKRQLTFIHDTGRGNYVQALNIKGQHIVKDLVESTGKAADFGKGVARASRALQMLNVSIVSVKDAIDGRNKCPIPSSPSSQNESTRLAGAKERIKASFFSILDGVGELFGTGYLPSGQSSDPATTLLGLKTLKGVILLLGNNVEQFTSKITSTLNMCLPTTSVKGQANAIGALLGETWGVYIEQLPKEVVVGHLDSFVIAAVGMTRVSESNAADLLVQLHKKTKYAKEEWKNVRHFLPTNNTALRPPICSEDTDFMDLLTGVVQGLTSLSRECRRVSLLALIDLLKGHREEMLGVCGRDEPPKIVINLVDKLLNMARDWDNDAVIHNYATSCLGLIGAIEPNKMTKIMSRADGKLEDLDDETFAVRLINDYLLKTLQQPSTQAGRASAHDKAAYCIQELLKDLRDRSQRKMPRRSDNDVSSLTEVQAYPWWNMINAEGQKKVAAYLDTKYVIVITQQRNAKAIEYCKGMSFRQWLKSWMVKLIAKTMGPRGTIMQNVRNVVKDDFDMALFILPYLVLNTCMHGGHDVIDQIAREMCTVLSHADANPRDASEHAQVVCSLLDKLAGWCNTVQGRVQLRKVTSSHARVSAEDEGKAKNIMELLDKVPYVLTRSWCDPNDLRLYQEVYSRLGERDGLLGVRHLRQQNAFQEELQEEAVDLETMGERMLECHQSLGQYSVITAYTKNRPELQQYTAQAAWRLGDWDLLNESLKDTAVGGKEGTTKKEKCSFERGLAQSLLALKKGDKKAVKAITYRAREDLHPELAAACLESYHTAYKYLVQLHVLTDIERAADVKPCEVKSFIKQLDTHTKLTEQTPETREIILTVRHALCRIYSQEKEAATTWLQLAKLCRTAGLFQVAEGALLRADRLADTKGKPPGLVLEQAKLMHAKGDVHSALRLVINSSNQHELERADTAKLRLNGVNWASEINHLPANEVLFEYKEISQESPSEAVFLSLAKFMEKMLMGAREDLTQQQSKKDPSAVRRHITKHEELITSIEQKVPLIFKAYGNSLNQGTKHLYHALPRLISLYISEISFVAQLSSEAKSDAYKKIVTMCDNTAKVLSDAMGNVMRSINGATLYTSLNTLVSLLTHTNPHAVRMVAEYVRKILRLFPERAVWAIMVFLFSSRNERVDVLEREVLQPMIGDPSFKKTMNLIKQAKVATTAINKLASYKVPGGTKKVNFHDFEFYKPLQKSLPLSIVVPIQSQLNLTLPNHVVTDAEAASLFSSNEGFKGVHAEAAVMASLQNPKKVTIFTTTGKQRSFLCKARDELRKDHRVMELCHIMNLLLKKNPETSRRQLYTRTFAVTMTGDASGMIEWVENVRPFRSILDDLYARAGQGLKTDAIRQIQKQKESKRLTALQALGKVLKDFPPILHKWLAEAFTDPATWFRARNTFTKSGSVWSMIGHIVGLGDRHAENILVDTATGDMVHVDFAVLFDKGMALTVPEVVRFRLTQNIVNGFGICGVEGVFRRCAELTMSVMRSNKDVVMSIMEQFIYDPCMEKTEGTELPNIGRRLDGYYDEPSELLRGGGRKKRPTGGVQLGVQGQVQKLIANATSAENLSVIYVWWMPWY